MLLCPPFSQLQEILVRLERRQRSSNFTSKIGISVSYYNMKLWKKWEKGKCTFTHELNIFWIKISLKIGCYHYGYMKFLMQLAKKIIYGKAKLINVKRINETYKKREFTNLKNHTRREDGFLCCFVAIC